MRKKLIGLLLVATQISIAQVTDTGDKVGVGTTNPSRKLQVAGDVRVDDGLLVGESYLNKVFVTDLFTNGVSDLAVDLVIGNISLWGYVELEVTSSYSYQNSTGKLTKIFAIGTNPNSLIYMNESRVSDAMGSIDENISIGEFQWSASRNSFIIPISHIKSTQNTYTIKLKVFSRLGGAKKVLDNASISNLYTLTKLPKNYVYFNDNVGIGTTTPDEKLSVNGNIHTKEVRVDLTGWSDFVFEDSYDLPSLTEVENHIKENGHLKDIPSAKDVEENGILLGKMNAKLLQKIEELTLYAIDQEDKISELTLKNNVQELKNRNQNKRILKLESLVNQLIKISNEK